MKKLSMFLLCFLFIACRKNDDNNIPPSGSHPAMRYIYLNNTAIRPGLHRAVDLDGDNQADFFFRTLLIGDPVLMRDRLQFQALSTIGTYVLADPENNTVVMNKGEAITTSAPQGYGWFEVQDVLLSEKITPAAGNIFWQGTWKDAVHKYLPLQIRNNGRICNGWIELTMDKAGEKLILHKAAISTEADKDIKAGY